MLRLAKVLVLGALAGVPFAGCTLNPQPLPPGEQPDAAATDGHGAGGAKDASTPPPVSNEDAGTNAGDDDSGAVPSDAGAQDGSGQFGDAAADAGHAGDAAADASDAGDASSDAGDAEAGSDADTDGGDADLE